MEYLGKFCINQVWLKFAEYVLISIQNIDIYVLTALLLFGIILWSYFLNSIDHLFDNLFAYFFLYRLIVIVENHLRLNEKRYKSIQPIMLYQVNTRFFDYILFCLQTAWDIHKVTFVLSLKDVDVFLEFSF